LLNYKTSTAFLEIIKLKTFKYDPMLYNVQISERETEYRCYKCDNIEKVICPELAGKVSAFRGR